MTEVVAEQEDGLDLRECEEEQASKFSGDEIPEADSGRDVKLLVEVIFTSVSATRSAIARRLQANL